MSSANITPLIRYLSVNTLKPHLSDHCQISYMLKIKKPATQKHNRDDPHMTGHRKLIWNKDALTKIPELLSSEEYKAKLSQILEGYNENDSPNTITRNFSKVLIEISEKAGLRYKDADKRPGEKKHNETTEAWFDIECKTEKGNLQSLGKQICRDPNDEQLRHKLHSRKRQFKHLCRKKKRQYVRNKLDKIDYSDTKNTWKQLRKLFNLKKQKRDKTTHIESKEFYDHFKKLNEKTDEYAEIEETYIESDEEPGPLDFEISPSEIKIAIDKLKNNRSPGKDNILNEVLKSGKDQLAQPLFSLFNIILKSGEYPQEWNNGFIIPIYKKGERSNTDNYRGITLLSCIGKLFTSILNERLNNYLTQKGILRREQGGFRKSQSTIDSIYSLKYLIDKYVKAKPKKRRNLLFSCFVDFKKAFDSIPREQLFQKMKKAGIVGKFYSILKTMYSNDISTVKIGDATTEEFRCYSGVKQGCMLSPTLFNLYLSDLPTILEQQQTDYVEIQNIQVSCLIYADDLVILSKTAQGLQQYLRKLEEYCNLSKLTVNIDKTKVLIFNNCGKRLNNYIFYYKEEKLENVQSYKYLGLTLSAFGNFSLAKHELKKVALKALFKIRKEMGDNFKTNVKLTLKLYDTLIKPILLYGSEIWGADQNKSKTNNDPLELVQVKFCKMLLGVTRKATNNACRAELGCFPLKVDSTYRAIKYWTKLLTTKTNAHMPFMSYIESINTPNPSYWSEKIKQILFSNGYGNVWLSTDQTINVNEFLKSIQQKLKDIEQQHWSREVHTDIRRNQNERNKLRTYRTFKILFNLENYLHKVSNIQHRQALTQIRISNHPLQIEKGRYMRPYQKLEDRICPLCDSGIEDERHFIIKCNALNEQRRKLFITIESIFNVNCRHMNENELFKLIINPPDKFAKQAAKYLYECLATRKNLLAKSVLPASSSQ